MYLYKRGSVWWCDYTVAGKRFRISCKTGNKKVAEAFTSAIKTARRMPTFEDAVSVLRTIYGEREDQGTPLSAAWETYLRVAKSVGRDALATSTLKARALDWGLFRKWCETKRGTIQTVEGVTPPIAAQYAAELDDGTRTAKTRGNHIGNLSAMWRIFEKTNGAIRNPWNNLTPIGARGNRGKAFTPEEVARVLKAAREVGKDWEPVCLMGLHTGLRYGDIAMMRWNQIDTDAIRITPRKTARHGVSVAIPLIEPIRQVLERLPRRDDFLFPFHAEVYERDTGAARRVLSFREVLERAGLYQDGYSFHSFRHTAASRLAAAGVGIEMRKRILGHTEDATAERYDHDEHLGEVREALEAVAKKESPTRDACR